MKPVPRYHPLLVMLHWVLACLIIAALIVGFFGLAATPNSDPQKVGILRVHMAVGMLILFLTGIRFVLRIRTPAPAEATTGYRLLDRIAPLSHYAAQARRYRLPSGFTRAGWHTAISPRCWSASLFCM